LNGDVSDSEKLLDSVADQTVDDFEIVAVTRGDEETSSLLEEKAPDAIRVVSDGSLADMRSAGFEQSTGDAVFFADSGIRVAKGFVQVVSGMFENVIPKIVKFHLQMFDSGSKTFKTERDSPRRSSGPVPVKAVDFQDSMFQKFGGRLDDKVFDRQFLESVISESDDGFSSLFAADEEPVSMLAVYHCDSISTNSLPIAVRVMDYPAFYRSLSDGERRSRLQMAVGVSNILNLGTDLVPGADAEPPKGQLEMSYLEWLEDFAVRGLEYLEPEAFDESMSAIADIVAPAVDSLCCGEFKQKSWRTQKLVDLSSASKKELVELYLDSIEDGLETKYDLECSKIELSRVKRDSEDNHGKSRFKGLFKR
jgi:glycosyltransferase involved in cell wall biosynthesis